jgi:hypothetical protein
MSNPYDFYSKHPEKKRWSVKTTKFLHDCGQVTGAIEVYFYRLVILKYGLWHIIHLLRGGKG